MDALAALSNTVPHSDTVIPAAKQLLRDVSAPRPNCTTCNMLQWCIPAGVEPENRRAVDQLVAKRIRMRKGDTLFRSGEKFTTLYAIRLGSVKTVLLAEDGRDQGPDSTWRAT